MWAQLGHKIAHINARLSQNSFQRGASVPPKGKSPKSLWQDFPDGTWLRFPTSNGEGLGSIPGHGTRSHKRQPRPGAAKKKKKGLIFPKKWERILGGEKLEIY